jgi:transcription elongation factor Elf1
MSFIDSKYIGLVSVKLHKFSKKKDGLYNFRCPYCGDSERHKNKARGYLYRLKNDHNFKCHNCGVSRTLTNFLKDVDPLLYDQYVFERYKAGATGKGSNTPEPKEFKFDKPNFAKKDFDLPKISELNTTHPARKFLDNRRIPDNYLGELYFAEKFKEWTNTQKYTFNDLKNDEPRIIIPLKNNGKIFGYQGRSINPKSKLKYITIILDDTQPKIYGLDNIDWNKKIYIVEGPFDSMFLNNSIAMVGADIDRVFFDSNSKTDFIMVYDNEKRNKQIVDRMQKSIDMSFPTVIWPDTIDQKDINDMVLSGLNVQSVIESNVYSGLQAKTKLTSWKKT